MRKEIISLLVIGTMLLGLVGCGSTNQGNLETQVSSEISETQTEISSIQKIAEETIEDEIISELEPLGDIEVDEGLFDVEITIPADYVGETSQEELNAMSEEKGFKSVTLNADGSATYIMTKKQHKEMLDGIAESINQSLNEMVSGGDYSFTAIEANDDFTEFTVTTTATELGLGESMSVFGFYMYGGMYSIFSGEKVDNIHVSFINADSGEVISESNSKDMAN